MKSDLNGVTTVNEACAWCAEHDVAVLPYGRFVIARTPLTPWAGGLDFLSAIQGLVELHRECTEMEAAGGTSSLLAWLMAKK